MKYQYNVSKSDPFGNRGVWEWKPDLNPPKHTHLPPHLIPHTYYDTPTCNCDEEGKVNSCFLNSFVAMGEAYVVTESVLSAFYSGGPMALILGGGAAIGLGCTISSYLSLAYNSNDRNCSP